MIDCVEKVSMTLNDDFIWACLYITAMCTVSLYLFKIILSKRNAIQSSSIAQKDDGAFRSLRWRYLGGYTFAVLADWLQGPYVYALYSAYGIDKATNGWLFICGFGSSMLFGTMVASLADKFGRKRFVILFCMLYGFACFTKHFSYLPILFLGRLVSGVSTSLLFSVFESWLCGEAERIGLKDRLSELFALQVIVNSIATVSAGVLAQFVSDLSYMQKFKYNNSNYVDVWNDILTSFHYGGYVSPFDLAIFSLCIAAIVVSLFWTENFGQQKSASSEASNRKVTKDSESVEKSKHTSVIRNFSVVLSTHDIRTCGLISALFEASMYIFVFMWTPSLQSASSGDSNRLSFGLIFASFMLACMLGSQLFSLIGSESKALNVCISLALLSHAVAAITATSNPQVCFLAFLAFECSVGLYFPSMGTIKARVVPESIRAGVYSIFRVPLNAIVVITLLSNVSTNTAFKLTATLLGTASLLMMSFYNR